MVKTYMFLYACLMLAGAYMGLKAGSKISFRMGAISGMFILFALKLTSAKPFLGFILLALGSAALTAVFIKRFKASGKVMPAGMLMGASIGALVLSLFQLFKH